MINNKKTYSRFLLLIIVLVVLTSTQSFAATVAKVTGLKSEAVSTTQAGLTWTKVSNATGYEVYIKEDGKVYSSIGKVSTPNVLVSGLVEGRTYYAKVRAYVTTNGSTSYGQFSSEVKVTAKSSGTNNGTLSKVTNLKVTATTTTTATLSWSNVANSTGYEVYMKEGNSAYEKLGNVSNAGVTINGLTSNTTVYVKVRAYRTVNGSTTYGAYSDEVKVTTQAPNTNTPIGAITNLKVAGTTNTSANLTWTALTNITGYQVYLKIGNGSYNHIGNSNSNNVTINGLTAGTTYTVKIRAYRTVNGSTTYGNYSSEVKFTTTGTNQDNTAVGTVTNLKVTGTTNTTASTTWTAVSNVTGYQVYLKEGNNAYSNIGNTTNANANINGLKAGTTYTVKVRAYRTTNGTTKYGNYSSEVTFTTTGTNQDNTKLGTVTNLKVTGTTNTTASLTWTAVSNASGYQVYIKEGNNAYQYIGNTSNSKVTVNSLTAGTSYTIKVRAYRTVNGSTTYGDYSSEVTFKTTGTNPDNTQLAQVKNVALASITNTSANITWGSVANATAYDINVRKTDGTYTNAGTTTATNTTINGLTAGSTYYVKVRAVRTANGKTTYGPYSADLTIKTTGTNPDDLVVDTVTNLTVSLNGTTATFNWNGVSNVVGYEVYLNIPGSGYVSLGTTYKTTTTINTLRSGTQYTAKVRAYRQVNGQMVYGNFSNEVTFTTPNTQNPNPNPNPQPNPQPVNLGKVLNVNANVGATMATFNWDKVAYAEGYEIQISIAGNTYLSLGNTSKDNVRILGLTAGTQYGVKVRAYKMENGQKVYGEFSDEYKFITAQNDVVGTVANLKVNPLSNSAKLTWDVVDGAQGYEISIKKDNGEYQVLGKITNKNAVRIVNLAKGSTFAVKIRAYSEFDGKLVYGDYSNEVTFKGM